MQTDKSPVHLMRLCHGSEPKPPGPGPEEFIMNKTTLFRRTFGLFVIPVMVCLLALPPRPAHAQDASSPATSEKFSQEELAQMLGPIALYPDKLLSQILMASTYPLEVIEADRWVKKNPQLEGDPLDRALLDKEWDPSIKAICHFPAVLAQMSERITETTNLGNAFLAQETEVMGMVQELRAKAYARGNLTTTPEQKVIVEQKAIVIEPANPRVIYVPYYDPFYIYGPWWYPAYPPYYWGPTGVSLGIGMSFWPGIYFGFSWGTWSYVDWHHHYVHIHAHERPRYVRHDRWYSTTGRWTHTPVHRRGVAYRDKYTATKYGQYPQRHSNFRGEVRGFPEPRDPGRERSRTDDVRTRIDHDRRVDDNSRYQRSQEEQQRIEQKLRHREPQVRQPADRDRQAQPSIDRDRLRQERAGQERQEPTSAERVPHDRQRIEQKRPLRQSPDYQQRSQPVRGEQAQRRRETVFDQQEYGRGVRQSSERGRASRQQRGDVLRGSGQRSEGQGSSRDGGGRHRH
jgi:hypothetical protein